jgi:hypothetical protein
VRRREGIGGVTIAVVGLVLALSVGIGATAQGGVFDEGLTGSPSEPLPAAVPEPGTAPADEMWDAISAKPAGVGQAGASTRTTVTVTVQTVVSSSAASANAPSGTCVVETRIVTSAPATADSQPRVDVRRHLSTRGGPARLGSKPL